MTSNTRFWAPFAARFTFGFAAASVAILALSPRAEAQTPAQNKAAVEAKFDAWKAGAGNPFELLADEASWTIEGNSLGWAGYHHFCLNVDSVEATVEKLRARGVTIVTEPFVLEAISRKLAFFCDPFGNLIELAEVIA